MCRRSLLLFALLGCPALLNAQGFNVEGRVVDGTTGSPLSRATISLEGLTGPAGNEAQPFHRGGKRRSAEAALTTGADGTFRFPDLPAGRYLLSATRRGYLGASFQEHDGFFAAIIVGPGAPPTTSLRFPLLPLASIEGKVLDSSGDPVENGTVSLFAQSTDGTGTVRPRQTAQVELGGSSFEFSDLPPGTYYLAVSARPWFAEHNTPDGTADPLDRAYPLLFFESAESASGAVPIQLKAGETAQADFSLQSVPAVQVRFETEADRAFQLPQLSGIAFGGAIPLNTDGAALVNTGSEGQPTTVSMSVAPGAYLVNWRSGTSLVNAGGDTSFTDNAADGGATLTGKIAMADGSAIPAGMRLTLIPLITPTARGGGPMISLGSGIRRRGGAVFGTRPIDLALDAEGGFHADAVPPGDYRLGVSAGGSGTVMVTGAAASGAKLSDDLTLHAGSDPAMLAVTVGAASGAVTGRTVGPGGRPESGAMVLLVPQDGSAVALYGEDESDSDGTWTIRQVVPGAYQVVAIRDGWDLAWKRPGVLARYLAAGGVPVIVTAHGRVALSRDVPVQPR